ANTRRAARSSTWVRNGLRSKRPGFPRCVRFKSLEDLALDTRGSASGTGTRQRTRMSHAKREVGAACALLLVQRRSRDNRLVGRSVGRVPVQEHISNYRAARALLGKGKKAKPKK